MNLCLRRSTSGERCNVRFAIVRGPLYEARVHKTPGRVFRVDLHQHVGIGIVARGGHDVVLRTVVMVVVDPLVLVTGDDKLNGALILAQERM